MSMSTAECHAEQSPSLLERTLKRLLGTRGLTSRGLMSPSALDVHELIEQGLSSEDVIRFVESVELLHVFLLQDFLLALLASDIHYP